MELSLFHQLREHFEFFWIFIFRCHWAILSMTKPPRQIESCERNFLHNFRCCNFSAFTRRLTVAFAVENAMEKLENAQCSWSVKQTRSHWGGGGKALKIFCRCNKFFSLSQSNNHCVLFLIFSPQPNTVAVGTKQWKFSTFSEIEAWQKKNSHPMTISLPDLCSHLPSSFTSDLTDTRHGNMRKKPELTDS